MALALPGARGLFSYLQSVNKTARNRLRLTPAFHHALRAGVTAARGRSADTAWQRWADFCAVHHLDPTLQDLRDPVPILQVYAYRYRTGTLAPSQRPVRSRTVEDSLRHVGQTLAALGSPDPV